MLACQEPSFVTLSTGGTKSAVNPWLVEMEKTSITDGTVK